MSNNTRTNPSSSTLTYQRLLAQLGLEHPTEMPAGFYRRLARKLAHEPVGSVTAPRRQAA